MPDQERQEALPKDGRRSVLYRSRLAKLLLLCFSSLLTVTCFEIGFRLVPNTPWWERIVEEQKPPPRSDLPKNIRIIVRHDPFPRPKVPGAYRILFLGDSFTVGSGVRDRSKIFVRLVEQHLNATKPAPGIDRFDVFNGGIGGSLTHHWVELFEQVSSKYDLDADLVVAVFFMRDGAGQEATSRGLIRGIEEGMNSLKEESLLYRHSHMYRYFRNRRQLRILSDRYLGILRRSYFGETHETTEWQRAQENLLWLRDETERQGGRFAMVIFPVLIQLNENYPLADVDEVLAQFCRSNGIPVTSLLPDFLNRDAPSLWVSLYNQHPNEEGHAIAAAGISRFLEELIADSNPSKRSLRSQPVVSTD